MKARKLVFRRGELPAALNNISSPPNQLFYLGDNFLELLKSPCVAIVGSRKISPYGRFATEKLSSELAKQGMVIISGLALGVDGLAHKAALDAGGKTIAVLPGPLDHIYPSSHFSLAKAIVEKGGALVSEYTSGSEIRKHNFIERNRLVSGLSQAVLIPEAAQKSGSLHTANFALEQGKEVLAVPGNINSALSIGTNNLIKAGASPVTEAKDVLNALGLAYKDESQQELFAANEYELAILRLLAGGILDAEELMIKSRLDATTFSQTLTMLEISGKIRPNGGGQWSLN